MPTEVNPEQTLMELLSGELSVDAVMAHSAVVVMDTEVVEATTAIGRRRAKFKKSAVMRRWSN